jgi:murein DD-endopeptidase MepM/ murein hydrolase activator NlpD
MRLGRLDLGRLGPLVRLSRLGRLGEGRLSGGRPAAAAGVAAAPAPWSLEVQIHPSDIRKRVRYFFLSRGQVTFWSVLALLYLLVLALAAGLAPAVIRTWLGGHEYQALISERTRQGERLQELLSRLDPIEERAEALRLRTEKIDLAYGLSPVKAPARAAAAPASSIPESLYAGAIEQGERRRVRISSRLRYLDASLTRAREFERAHPERVSGTPAVCPLRGDFVLTAPFGRRRSPFTGELELHPAIDLAAPLGSPVYAPGDGVVVFAGRYPLGRSAAWWRQGNLVALRHGDDFITLFGQLDEIRVRPGQRLRRGEVLGTVGRSVVDNSTHLHYEVRRREATTSGSDFRPVDPLIFILDRRWPNEERLLARARSGPAVAGFEPLPREILR